MNYMHAWRRQSRAELETMVGASIENAGGEREAQAVATTCSVIEERRESSGGRKNERWSLEMIKQMKDRKSLADEGESREIQIEIDDDEQEDKPILQHLWLV